MATYHFTLKSGKTMKAAAHSDYISREGKYKNIKHENNDNKTDLVAKGYRLPKWAERKPKKFFNMADKFERKNGVSYKEFEFALPNELTLKQNKEIIDKFLNKYMKDKYFYYTIHDKKISSIEGKRNLHCHLMFSERIIDGINRTPEQFFKRYNSKNPEKGGAQKDRTFSDYKTRSINLKNARKYFEEITNITLEKYGIKKRVSCETLKEQKKNEKNIIKYYELDREPEKHINYIILRKNKTIINNINKQRKLIKRRAILLMQYHFEKSINHDEKNENNIDNNSADKNKIIKDKNNNNKRIYKQKIVMKFNDKNNNKNKSRSR